MKSSTSSIAALALAVGALVLSVPATPLHARQVSYSLSCPDNPDYVQSIPGAGVSSLQAWCSTLAVNLVCTGPGQPVPAFSYDLHDLQCDACVCIAEAVAPAPVQSSSVAVQSPAPVQPTCTGSMRLKPNLPTDTTPPTLQNWCLRPAVNTVCNPGVSVLGDDTENACLGACTCPS